MVSEPMERSRDTGWHIRRDPKDFQLKLRQHRLAISKHPHERNNLNPMQSMRSLRLHLWQRRSNLPVPSVPNQSRWICEQTDA
jgi:hypothetical protein